MFLNIPAKNTIERTFHLFLLTLFHASWYSCLKENKTYEKSEAFLAGCSGFFRTFNWVLFHFNLRTSFLQ